MKDGFKHIIGVACALIEAQERIETLEKIIDHIDEFYGLDDIRDYLERVGYERKKKEDQA